MNRVIELHLDSQLTIQKSELPEGFIRQIRQYLTLDNPRWIEADKRGYSKYGIDRYLYAYSEDDHYIYCYRGYTGSLLPFLCRQGYQYRLIDNRRKLPDVDFVFQGNLRDYQGRAVNGTLKKDFAVLVAPCGAGKTIMSLAIVAERRQPTLIIVHTRELLNQWVERIGQYLGISGNEVGIIGCGKEVIKPVTVGLVQTLCKRDLSEIREHFGFIIVDECHHTPASTFLDVAGAFDSHYMLGLSATPYRRDRLNKLIFVTLGNIAHEVKDSDLQDAGIRIKPEIVVRETNFNYDYQEDSDYQPMITALTEDIDRNRMIVSDVVQESDNYSLILSDRKAHLHDLAELLREHGIDAAILTADVPKNQREHIIQELDSGNLHIVFATSQLAGEGLDIPRLNRIFITSPVKWRGRLTQYIGRGLRAAEGKTDARIYDYIDCVGVLKNAFRFRQRVYESFN